MNRDFKFLLLSFLIFNFLLRISSLVIYFNLLFYLRGSQNTYAKWLLCYIDLELCKQIIWLRQEKGINLIIFGENVRAEPIHNLRYYNDLIFKEKEFYKFYLMRLVCWTLKSNIDSKRSKNGTALQAMSINIDEYVEDIASSFDQSLMNMDIFDMTSTDILKIKDTVNSKIFK